MELKTKLLMSFKTDLGDKISLAIDDPKPDLTEEEIINTMNLIVEKDVFSPKGGSLLSVVEAKVVQTDTTEYDLKL